MVNEQTEAKPKPLELSRGVATIPLAGIDVPFHSTYLSPGVDSVRSILADKLPAATIDLSMFVGNYIPNVVARPFDSPKTSVSVSAKPQDPNISVRS